MTPSVARSTDDPQLPSLQECAALTPLRRSASSTLSPSATVYNAPLKSMEGITGLPVQNVRPGRLGNSSNLCDQVLRCSHLAQAFSQKLNYGIHMRIVQATLDQVSMPGAHVLPCVGHRATKNHRQKALL